MRGSCRSGCRTCRSFTQGASDTGGLLPVLVLTCRIAPAARQASALGQLATFADMVRAELVDGLIDGDPEVAGLHDRARERIWSKRALTPREVATYGTHRCGWQRLVESGADYGLLLEDDFVLIDPERLRHLIAALPEVIGPDVDVLKLFDFPDSHHKGRVLQREVAGHVMLLPERQKAGTVGYILTARAARRLLARKRVFRAVDEDLRHYWEFGLRVWTLPQALVRDGSAGLGGSLPEAERNVERANRSRLRGLRWPLISLHRSVRSRFAFARFSLVWRGARMLRLR